MMNPAQIPQRCSFRVNPVPSAACAKRWWCSPMPADSVSNVLGDDDNTSSSPAPAPPLDDENLLEEILLRLSPRPSALPRASLVCKRWNNIFSDPQFLSRFRKHHRKPPLLGFFIGSTSTKHDFAPGPVMKPDRIPAMRFSVPKSSSPNHRWNFLGCRHGLTVLIHDFGSVAVVWDPLTGQQHRVPFPPGFRNAQRERLWLWHAAVLCADAEDGHVHGDCFSSPFKLILMCGGYTQAFACLYESAFGVWGNIISTVTTDVIRCFRPSILIRNAVYWLFLQGGILAFDIERQTLGVIEKPEAAHRTDCYSFQLLRTDDDICLGFAVMFNLSIQIWKRKPNCDGVDEWVPLHKIIRLEGLFPRGMHSNLKEAAMVGYDEESNTIVLATYIGDFMLQLESINFRRFSKRNYSSYKIHHPYRNFYTSGLKAIPRV